MPEPKQNTGAPTYVGGENMIRVGQPLPSKTAQVPMPASTMAGSTATGMGGASTASSQSGSMMAPPSSLASSSIPSSSVAGATLTHPCGTSHSTGVCGVVAPNAKLSSPQDFRMAGAEIELIAEYVALAAAESKGRAMAATQHVELAADMAKNKDDTSRTALQHRLDAYAALEHVCKKIARQGRKLAWLKDVSTFGHAVRYEKDAPELSSTMRGPATPDMVRTAVQSKTLPGLTLFKPSFIGKPIETQQQVNVISHELEAIGNFLIVEAQRYHTQSELEKRRAVDLKDKDVSSQCKHESKISLLYEKYGKKIARRGQEIGALCFV